MRIMVAGRSMQFALSIFVTQVTFGFCEVHSHSISRSLCVVYDLGYDPGDELALTHTANTLWLAAAEDCHYLCAAEAVCNYFTWNSTNGACWIQNVTGQALKPLPGIISGPKHCHAQHVVYHAHRDKSPEELDLHKSPIFCKPGSGKCILPFVFVLSGMGLVLTLVPCCRCCRMAKRRTKRRRDVELATPRSEESSESEDGSGEDRSSWPVWDMLFNRVKAQQLRATCSSDVEMPAAAAQTATSTHQMLLLHAPLPFPMIHTPAGTHPVAAHSGISVQVRTPG